MNLELIIILMLLMIGSVLLIDKKNNNKKNNDKKPNIFPYRKRNLLTKTEYSFYMELENTCSKYNIHICPKIRLEDLAEVTTKQNNMKYRGYIKSRHVDFTLCDDKLNIIAAIELDDYSHNSKKAKQTDSFKNQLFETIGIPLFRIPVCNNYNEHINNMFNQLHIELKPNETNTHINNMLEKQNDILKEQNHILNKLLEEQNKNSTCNS